VKEVWVRIVVKVIGMLSLEGGDRKRQRIAQFLMVIGGITAAVFGLLTALFRA